MTSVIEGIFPTFTSPGFFQLDLSRWECGGRVLSVRRENENDFIKVDFYAFRSVGEEGREGQNISDVRGHTIYVQVSVTHCMLSPLQSVTVPEKTWIFLRERLCLSDRLVPTGRDLWRRVRRRNYLKAPVATRNRNVCRKSRKCPSKVI